MKASDVFYCGNGDLIWADWVDSNPRRATPAMRAEAALIYQTEGEIWLAMDEEEEMDLRTRVAKS